MSEITNIFQSLPKKFRKENVKKARTFYFSFDEDEKWTVSLSPEKIEVTPGKPEKDADCFFKSTSKLFMDVWSGKHTPGAKDFLTGAIKSNNPLLLKEFVEAFKEPKKEDA
jgi:putative sterol carrier protein